MHLDVFLSYSNSDRALARNLCKYLEVQGFTTWLSARDLPLLRAETTKSPERIIRETLSETNTLLLVLSDQANVSAQVIREVEMAVAHGLRIVVLKRRPTEAQGNLKELLEGSNWCEWNASPLKTVMPDLIRAIRLAGTPAMVKTNGRNPVTTQTATRRTRRLISTAAVLLLIGMGFLVLLAKNGRELNAVSKPYPSTMAIEVSADNVEPPRLPAQLVVPELENSVGIKLRLIPPGEFFWNNYSDTLQKQKVVITRPFWIATTELTRDQYRKVIGLRELNGDKRDLPMVEVNWEDAQRLCALISELPDEKSAGRFYRLPTEAEWEYACRAGTVSKYCSGDTLESLESFAWTNENSNLELHMVAQKKSNFWGLFDMHGNVWEMCSDWASEYPHGTLQDPTGPATGQFRVIRGGGITDRGDQVGSSVRGTCDPSKCYEWIGFRVVMELRSDTQMPNRNK